MAYSKIEKQIARLLFDFDYEGSISFDDYNKELSETYLVEAKDIIHRHILESCGSIKVYEENIKKGIE